MASTDGRDAGPRAKLKAQQARDTAQSMMQRQREQVREAQNDSPYERPESIAQSFSQNAVARLVMPSCLDVSSEEELQKLTGGQNESQKEAVTYWSHELSSCHKAHFATTPLSRGAPLFAKCTAFSNEIEDSRLHHNETDNVAHQ
ncbi:hypothetical protein ACHAXT_010283 [Thalassiosira profunda]